MSILVVEDLVQLISQYSPEVYCLLRFVNHEVKNMVDEVLPNLGANHDSNRRRKFLLQCGRLCGFKLFTDQSFGLWIQDLLFVFHVDPSKLWGENIEKFCRHYLPKKPMVPADVLYLLCLYNRGGIVRELWNEGRLQPGCIRDIAMLDDVDLLMTVHSAMDVSPEMVKECIERASSHCRWKNTQFLWKNYESNDGMKEIFQDKLQVALRFGFAQEDVDPILREDKELLLQTIKTNGNAFRLASDTLRKDREIVLSAVKQDGDSLQYADASYKKDKEIVLAAVKQDGNAIQYADASLQKDKEIILEAVSRSGRALWHADESLRKDKEIVLEAVKQDGWALKYAHESLRKDKEIVLEAVSQDGNALQFADESLQSDESILAAMEQDTWSLDSWG